MDRSSFEASRRARAKQRELEGHPAPGDLAAYHAGRLTEEKKRQVQNHLAVCEGCAVLYDTLIEFEQHPPESAASGEDQSAAAWLRFRERLREEEAAEAPAPAQEDENTLKAVMPLQRRRVPVLQRPGVAWAVAAMLALCVVGLGIRGMTPPEPPAERSESGLRQVIPLEEDGALRGGRERTEEPINPTVEEVVYELDLDSIEEATYEADLLAATQAGKPLRTFKGQATKGYFAIGIERDFLSPGLYRFEVYRIEGNGNRTDVGTYSFKVP